MILGFLSRRFLERRDSLFNGRGDLHVRAEGDHLGDLVHFGQGDLQDPADVADGRPGGHRPEGDDLADVVLAVLSR